MTTAERSGYEAECLTCGYETLIFDPDDPPQCPNCIELDAPSRTASWIEPRRTLVLKPGESGSG